MQRRAFLALAALAMTGTHAGAADSFPLRGKRRAVFLGDSITYAGMYVDYVEAFVRTRFPEERVELLNLGLPSEGVTGLSEPDHPYPRPDLHERLDRVLERTRPDVVVACYGMNDGIYYPFTEERFRRYQAGIRKLLEKAKRAGATITLMTPPPFDPVPLHGKTLPEEAVKFSWMTPFSGYDGVLERYAAWLLTLRSEGVEVVDQHGPVSAFLREMRKSDPEYALAGDGVHLSASGHAIMAATLLEAWHAPRVVERLEIDARSRQVTSGGATLDRATDRSLVITWQAPIPFPYDPQWAPGLADRLRLTERFNEYRLRVTGLPEGRYTVAQQGGSATGEQRLGEFSHTELGTGVNLLRLPALTTNLHAASVLSLVQKRQRLLGSAWLTSVGHKRPDTAVGLPLDEAQRQAEPLEREIRRAASPVALRLLVSR